ncbi:MAG TPA: substrate-binding domain-containing protein [Baekduia sp.]|nr:substrate-binding domain-containing protein [Baekduia sp.]
MHVPRSSRSLTRLALAAIAAASLAVAGCGSSDDSSSGSGGTATAATTKPDAKKKYTVYLSNSFIGNDFRVLMEKETAIAAVKGPLAGRVDLKIANADSSVTSQIASLNQIIQQKPDAILLDAASATALNPVVARACAAGIKVVSFDETVTAPCAWKVGVDVNLIGKAWANWFIKSVGPKAEIFDDLGLPGHGLSEVFNGYLKAAIKENPGVKIVCTFQSKYALGPEQDGVAKCLGAHPKVDGIYALGYAAGAMKALKAAGHPQVPVTGGGYNIAAITCYNLKGSCLLGSYPPSIGAVALQNTVKILDGEDLPKDLTTPFPFFQQGGADTTVPGEKVTPLKVGENVFPDLPGGTTIPWQIPGLPDVTLDEINKTKI